MYYPSRSKTRGSVVSNGGANRSFFRAPPLESIALRASGKFGPHHPENSELESFQAVLEPSGPLKPSCQAYSMTIMTLACSESYYSTVSR